MPPLPKRPPYDPVAAGCLCAHCPLRGKPVVAPKGPLDADFMIVGESPGYHEEQRGEPFIGASGVELDSIFHELGKRGFNVSRKRTWVTNTILCLEGSTQIVMADRSTKKIRHVVRDRDPGPVLAVDDQGRLVARRITNWYTSARNGRKLFKLTSEHAKGNGNGDVGPVLTEDHPVLTRRGWVPVSEIRCHEDEIATGHVALSGSGLDVVLGSMLGDGAIPREAPGRSDNLLITHRVDFADYVYLKARSLAPLSPDTRTVKTPTAPQLHMRTQSTPWLGTIGHKWYGPKERFVPRDLKLTPMIIAIWFFDNGYMRFKGGNHRPRAEFATNRFSKGDVEFLASLLEAWGVRAKVRSGSGWRLDVGVETVRRLSELIAPYAPPSMQYKLLPEHRGRFDPSLYEPEEAITFVDRAIVKPAPAAFEKNQTVFCIDVEEVHNFATVNGIVHNCRPETPGVTGTKRYDFPTYLAWIRKQNAERKKAAMLSAKAAGWKKGDPTPQWAPIASPIDCCAPRLWSEIAHFEKVARDRGEPNGVAIVPAGNYAAEAIVGRAGIMRLRGSPFLIDLADPRAHLHSNPWEKE